MKKRKYRIKNKLFICLLLVALLILPGCGASASGNGGGNAPAEKIPIRWLILPKFEIGSITGDAPGEAQLFYEAYCKDGMEYELPGSPESLKLYVKDGIALCLLSQGKVSAAINTGKILSDSRFDFSDAYILGVGCCGAARGYGRMGDVYLISAAVDYDLGHTADPREMKDASRPTWFHDESLDPFALVTLNSELTNEAFELTKGIRPKTTEITDRVLAKTFPGEEWASRPPAVLLGTTVTSDNYWKGLFHHQNALSVTKTYHCSDPFVSTEMEDIALARTVESFGLLDRLIIIRSAVNMDVFLAGTSPENLWINHSADSLSSDESIEALDIFTPAMENCFSVGSVLIDRLLIK